MGARGNGDGRRGTIGHPPLLETVAEMTLRAGFRLREWTVHPQQNRLTGPAGEVRLNSRAMDVLVYLAQRAGEVVSREDFSQSVWGRAVVTDDSLTWCVSELRRQLGDRASSPRFIETIPKRGYRLVVPVEPLEEDDSDPNTVRDESRKAAGEKSGFSTSRRIQLGILVLAAVVALASWLFLANRGPPPSMDRSIAVLPFDNFSTDGNDAFAKGLHHDLLTRLSTIGDLRVISSTSVQRYHDSTHPVSEIARALDVAWVLEGAVQEVGNEIQLNAQLIDVSTDSHVWARTYRRELTAENLFGIQAEIADDIATAMQARLSPAERNRVIRTPTENLDAYTLAIRAKTLLDQRTESSMRRAAEIYRQAIELDDEYADAWVGLADARMLLVYYGHADAEAELPRARENALAALELDPDLPRAYSVIGAIHMQFDHNGPAALKALERAYRLSSDHVGWFAWMQAVAGDLQQALTLTREQARRSPFTPSVQMSLAFLYLVDHQPEVALEHARTARELSPGYAKAWLLEGQALESLGQESEAVEAMERAMDYSGRDTLSESRGWLAAAYAKAGDTGTAGELIDGLESAGDHFDLGIAQVGRGNYKTAIQSLGRNGWDDFQTITLRYHPFLDPLRDDEDFHALIQRLDRFWGFE